MNILTLPTINENIHSALNLGPWNWRGLVAGAGLEYPSSCDWAESPRADSISGPGTGKMDSAPRGQENPLEIRE